MVQALEKLLHITSSLLAVTHLLSIYIKIWEANIKESKPNGGIRMQEENDIRHNQNRKVGTGR